MLTSDSFLPSAFTDHDPNMPPSAVISPLSLSRMANSPCYFDNKSTSNVPGHSLYSTQSSGAVRYPPPSQSSLQPHLRPNGANGLNSLNGVVSYDQMSRVVSPSHPENLASYSSSAFPPPVRVSPNGMPHPRSVSADAASAPASAQIIRRLAQQNARIREAWEAERKYMEANRERVEEVYREERMIMEDERLAWEAEKATLLEHISRLKNQVAVIDADKIRLQCALQRFELEKAGKVAGVTVAIPGTGTRGGGADGSTQLSFPGFSSQLNDARFGLSNGTTERKSTNGSASASVSPTQIRPRFISPGSSRISPSRQPETLSFFPLNPNMQPTTADPVDFLGSPKDEQPVPIVDIQIINPQLEGVPLKAPAIQKSTFTDSGPTPENSKCSSRNASPPGGSAKSRRSPTQEHTLQVLAAPEPDRLVMHAGHTPSHSLSVLGTAAGTEVATATEGTGGSTPTLAPTDMSSNPATLCDAKARLDSSDLQDDAYGGPDEPQPTLEATDDVALKGPLMVRNIPAHDEIFFKRLSEKLQDVSSGADAVPTCMKTPSEHEFPGPTEDKENLVAPNRDSDAASDRGSATDRDDLSESQNKAEEIDVPLKLKKTINFGAPLGSMF
ncbi:hypothetical protein CGRA01v4_14775 [Colletotrichum graminicola]|uniref:Uncharacterized protein n=1 Tax=Colletotrichum graminicola (strain M1.001 / M2 / FGSC 10212) TaxID=645133 RepID=E3QF76_COLGM|nr:uncharacterized protein GLRG_04658 [Colletotrichum graminicola M1.001]EFQ29514.1 hypothetical protein GLRG_04658 [Colletotrichum graminicola M1.001]WDK23483.1 hypothetical protein CGRA01v4_14775 [Colletotrichum graminicola]